MFIGNLENQVNYGRGPDKSPRKKRSDAGKKRTPSIGKAIGTAAKYGAGLYVGSRIWNKAHKLGETAGKKTIGRLFPKAKENSIIDKTKKGAIAVGALAAADGTAKLTGASLKEARRLYEERKERKARKKKERK